MASLNNVQANVATDAEGNLDTDKLQLVHLNYYYDAAGTEQPNNPANRMTIQLAEGVMLEDLYVYDEEEEEWVSAANVDGVSIGSINTSLAKVGRTFMMYNGGKAFFYVPIKHYTDNMSDANANFPVISDLKTGNIGVVRNHVYNMTINKITGLGIGVGPDPSVPELPDPKPVQNYYINAQLNVLQWHVMGQSVDL